MMKWLRRFLAPFAVPSARDQLQDSIITTKRALKLIKELGEENQLLKEYIIVLENQIKAMDQRPARIIAGKELN